MRKALTGIAAGVLALVASGAAAAPAGEARLADLQFGEYWYGAEIDHADLVGKVVLVEYWGS